MTSNADIGRVEPMLLDLLAVIHRDGGHYTEEVGLEQSWLDAMQLSSERIASIEQAADLPSKPDLGAFASEPGSRASHEAPTGLHPTGFDPSRWQPISSAPKDGRKILIWWDGRVLMAVWEGVWTLSDGTRLHAPQPTHWMPLPQPPSDSDGSRNGRDREAGLDAQHDSAGPKDIAHD